MSMSALLIMEAAITVVLILLEVIPVSAMMDLYQQTMEHIVLVCIYKAFIILYYT